MSPTYGYVTKLFLESKLQINKRKNTNSQQKLAGFSAGTDSENKNI